MRLSYMMLDEKEVGTKKHFERIFDAYDVNEAFKRVDLVEDVTGREKGSLTLYAMKECRRPKE